jgi:ABC-2 type transport system ATP-binding protein
MPALEVSDLHKSYGSIQALHGVSFNVEAGEVLGYLGPNGAGKTTTLRILMGLVHADAGRVRLLGEPLRSPAVRERIGYLPGELALYGDLTARTLLDLFARFRPRRPPVLQEHLLQTLSLEAADLSRKLKFLSHGTRQKVGLVLAMQHDPDLLVLDEPTTGLDPLVQRGFRDVLRERVEQGRAVLLSSHVLSEAEAMCHRVAVLRAGELLTVESVEVLRQHLVRRVQLHLRGAVPETLSSLPGVTRSEINGQDVVLWVQGDVNPVLRAVAQVDVERFVFSEPQLEDVFLGFFAGEGQ